MSTVGCRRFTRSPRPHSRRVRESTVKQPYECRRVQPLNLQTVAAILYLTFTVHTLRVTVNFHFTTKICLEITTQTWHAILSNLRPCPLSRITYPDMNKIRHKLRGTKVISFFPLCAPCGHRSHFHCACCREGNSKSKRREN